MLAALVSSGLLDRVCACRARLADQDTAAFPFDGSVRIAGADLSARPTSMHGHRNAVLIEDTIAAQTRNLVARREDPHEVERVGGREPDALGRTCVRNLAQCFARLRQCELFAGKSTDETPAEHLATSFQ